MLSPMELHTFARETHHSNPGLCEGGAISGHYVCGRERGGERESQRWGTNSGGQAVNPGSKGLHAVLASAAIR